MLQEIIGFHKDEKQYWVADLSCGHSQHMRHNPPWMKREWVLTEEGRQSRIGTEIDCVECVDTKGTLPLLRSR